MLSRMAAALYPTGPWLFRSLQRYRPYICPFEALIAEVPEGARVLDIGCGGGLFLGLATAAGLRPDGTGFDVSVPALALAKGMAEEARKAGARLDFRRIDANAPWPEGDFDVVSMIDVIHHVPRKNQQEVIRRACAKVKPGGCFLYKDMVERPRWRAAANRLHDLVLARQWIHYVPASAVQSWAADEGLDLERSERFDRLWYGHELFVFRRAKVHAVVQSA
jgi:2-polyprenyl-3-methyl-5-hydroxy-6-metoxy-1,4-benzoquinol methylase